MKIAILSRRGVLYSTRRLKQACLQRGHEAHVIDYVRCCIDITAHAPRILYAGEELRGFDAVVPRIGVSETFYGTAVVRQFETMGVFCSNDADSIIRSRDKLRAMQIMARAGIGLPVTGCASSTKDTDGLIDIVGGTPLVVKLVEGSRGVGVILAETRSAAQAVIEAFRGLDANILVQEYIAEAGGSDIRCLVVGDRVVAGIRRTATPGEFRANLHQGGEAVAVEPTDAERETAVRAARSIGLNVAGVDILRSDHGPVVIEVNSSPGLEGIEQATGIDVASAIVEFLEQRTA